MDGPHSTGPIGEKPILITYVIISTGQDNLNTILQCLHVPEACAFTLRLRDADSDEEFDVSIGRLTSVEHDTANPGIVHFTACDQAERTITAHLNYLITEPGQPIGLATIGMRL